MKKAYLFSILLLIAVLICTSCVRTGSVTNYYKNEEIEKGVVDEIAALDNLLIESIISGDDKTFNSILRSDLRQEIDKNPSFFNLLREALNDADYRYFERYHLKISTLNSSSPVVIFSDNNDYSLSLTGKGEMFLSIILIPHGCIDSLLFIIYDNNNEDWEIQTIYLGDYQFYGMDANDMYNEAIRLKNESRIVSAYQYAYSSGLIIRPAPFFQYTNESEIMDDMNALVEEVNNTYDFPITLKSSGVEVFGISSQVTQQDIVPVFMYLTEFDADGSEESAAAIRQEAHQIHEEVMNVFVGLDQDFDIFLYKAYNEYPSDPDKEYYAYSTIIGLPEK